MNKWIRSKCSEFSNLEYGAITQNTNDFFIILAKQNKVILTENATVYAVNCTVDYFSSGSVYG